MAVANPLTSRPSKGASSGRGAISPFQASFMISTAATMIIAPSTTALKNSAL